jgi:putative glycosyltransferase (TIGR04372 family)
MMASRLAQVLKADLEIATKPNALNPAIYDLRLPGVNTKILEKGKAAELFEAIRPDRSERGSAQSTQSSKTNVDPYDSDLSNDDENFDTPISKKINLSRIILLLMNGFLRGSLRDKSGDKALPGSKKKLAKFSLKNKSQTRIYRFHRKYWPLPYEKRHWLASMSEMVLCPDAQERGAMEAARLGLDPEKPLALIHAREAGFKRGREVQDLKVRSRDDSTRNVDVDTYIPTIDKLIAENWQVVRIGDDTMRPIAPRPNLFDLTSYANRTGLLEVYCASKAGLLIASESGPMALGWAFGIPQVTTNCTDPVSSFPFRKKEVFLLKHVFDKENGRFLSIDDYTTTDYLLNIRQSDRFEYYENTPDEILNAVEHVLCLDDSGQTETPEQRKFRNQLTDSCTEISSYSYIRKWGPETHFLGRGHLDPGFLKTWENASQDDYRKKFGVPTTKHKVDSSDNRK